MTQPIQKPPSPLRNDQANASRSQSNPRIEGRSHQGSGTNTPLANSAARIARVTMPAIAEEKRVHFNNNNSDDVTTQTIRFSLEDPPKFGGSTRFGEARKSPAGSSLAPRPQQVKSESRKESIIDETPNLPSRRGSISSKPESARESSKDSAPNLPTRRGSISSESEQSESPTALPQRGDSPPRLPSRG